MANEEEKTTKGDVEGCDDVGPDVEVFDSWVRKHYGESSRTKTITNDKYSKICQLIRGEDSNTNAKFRFWVRSKGFRLISHDKTTDVVNDDPDGSLFVSLHAKEDATPAGEKSIESFLRTNLPAISFFRKVAMVEDFYDIIKCAHVDERGVHAGQKKTYRVVSDTYAFLPREVITFYLLNCNTCKPRIQKYGPIHSKVKTNKSLSPKLTNEKSTPYPTEADPGKYERDSVDNSTIIRPSPKRFVPSYMDLALSTELYTKMYDSQLKPRNANEMSSLQIPDRMDYYKNDTTTKYPLQIESKHEQQILDRFEKDYSNYPPNTISNNVVSISKSVSTFSSTRPATDYHRTDPSISKTGQITYSELDERKIDKTTSERPLYPEKSISAAYAEMSTCTGSCCAHLNATLEYFQKKKEKLDRYHGYRMEPYKLFQRNESIRNYQERLLEARHNKDTLFHSKSSSLPYFGELKDKYISSYREEKGWPKDEFPSTSSFWHETLLSGNIAESSWKSFSRQAEMQLKTSYRSNYQ